jgi:hypothetical protein
MWVRRNLVKKALLPVAPVKTRWYTFADALKRYIDIHADLKQYAQSLEATSANADVLQSNVLDDRGLHLAKSVWPMLDVIKQASLYL